MWTRVQKRSRVHGVLDLWRRGDVIAELRTVGTLMAPDSISYAELVFEFQCEFHG